MSVFLVCRDSRQIRGEGASWPADWSTACAFARSVDAEAAPRQLVLNDSDWLEPLSGALLSALDNETRPGDWLLTSSPVALFSASQDVDEGVHLLVDRSLHWHDLTLHATLTDPDARVNSRMLIHCLAAIDRQRAARRIRKVKQRQRRQGRYLGGSRPFGYMIHENGRLLENPMEQRILRRIHQLRQQGWSLRAIASEVSTPMTPISFKTVQRIVQRHV